MENWITPAVISLIVTQLAQLGMSLLKNRNQQQSAQTSRDQEIADRYYSELKSDIKQLQIQLIDAENRADKWQEMYYQLYAKYQFVKAQFEKADQHISELKTSIEELKTRIQTKEQFNEKPNDLR